MCIITLINILFSEFETQFVGHNIDILAKLLKKNQKGPLPIVTLFFKAT